MIDHSLRRYSAIETFDQLTLLNQYFIFNSHFPKNPYKMSKTKKVQT